MEFLVHLSLDLPPDMPQDLRAQLYADEGVRAQELFDAGHLLRLWRIPGQRANYGLWRAEDATELHEVLTSLPLFALPALT